MSRDQLIHTGKQLGARIAMLRSQAGLHRSSIILLNELLEEQDILREAYLALPPVPPVPTQAIPASYYGVLRFID